MMSSKLVLIFSITLLFSMDQANKYCDENMVKLCPNGTVHFLCYPYMIQNESLHLANAPMTKKLVKLILKTHNMYRNRTAGGNETSLIGGTFPKAARMRALIWDDELANLADAHARRCKMERSKCHNTDNYPKGGQTLGYVSANSKQKIVNVIERSIGSMYAEKDLIPDANQMAKEFQSEIHGEKSPNFPVLVNDRVSRVGCAIAYCIRADKHIYHMTCQYDMTSIPGQPIYVTDTTSASQCAFWRTEKSSIYKNLCYNTGRIFPINYKSSATLLGVKKYRILLIFVIFSMELLVWGIIVLRFE